MSQLETSEVNETYHAKTIDESGEYKVKVLNDLEIRHSDEPGISEPQLPNTAMGGFSKIAGDIEGISTRIEQTEQDISIVAQKANQNQSSINVQAGQIQSLSSDVSGNSSAITQNADNINLKVSKDKLISEINLSSEGVYIKGKNIQLDGNTSVLGSFSVTSIADAGDLARKDRVGSGDVNFNYASGSSKGGKYNKWLANTDLQSGNNPYNGVVFDRNGIRGYGSGNRNFELQADTGDVYMRGEIHASGGTIFGDLSVMNGGSVFVGGTGTGMFLENTSSGPGISLNDGGRDCGSIIGNGWINVNVGNTSVTLSGVEFTKSIVVNQSIFSRIDIAIDRNLIVGDRSLFYGKAIFVGDVSVNGDIVNDMKFSGNGSITLDGFYNRIYGESSQNAYIFYDGSEWKVRDAMNGTFTLKP